MHFLVAGPSKPRNSLFTDKGSFKAGDRGRGKGALCLGILSSLKLEGRQIIPREELPTAWLIIPQNGKWGTHVQQCKESVYLSLPDHLCLHYTI